MANEVRTAVGNALANNVIDYVHWECHKGEMNFINYSFKSIAANASSNILIATNSSKEVHINFEVKTNGPMIFHFYESAYLAATSVGTVASAINMNRNFSTSAGTVFYLAGNTTSNTTLGTRLINQMIIGDTGGGFGVNNDVAIGGQARNGVEWILKPNMNYFLTLINTAGVVRDLNVEAEFYEEN